MVRSRLSCVLLGVLTFVFIGAPCFAAHAVDMPADRLFPKSTVVYVELKHPSRTLSSVLDHPMAKQLQDNDGVRQALNNQGVKSLLKAVTYLEKEMQSDWQSGLDSVAGEGLYFGIDLLSQGGVALAHSRDAKSPEKLRDSIIKLIQTTAGTDKAVAKTDILGVAVHQVGDFHFASVGRWFIVTNKAGLARFVIGGIQGKASASLADDEMYQAGAKNRPTDAAAWAFVNTSVLHDLGVTDKAFPKRLDNPLGEILAGGVMSVLKKAPYVTAAINISRDGIGLSATAPFDPKNVPKRRDYYFGADAQGSAPAPLLPKHLVLSIRMHRDLASYWLNAPDLFDEKTVAGFTQAQSQLTMFFSGHDFGREIIGSFKPQIQIVATRQEFGDSGAPTPAIKLPAGALIFQLKDPKNAQRRFKVAYQSFVGFFNIVGSQNKVPPLELDSRKIPGGVLLTASYSPEDAPDPKNAKMYYNVSPSLVLVGDRMIIASTSALATELAGIVGRQQTSAKGSDKPDSVRRFVNSEVKIDLAIATQIFRDNREHLIVNNMLEKGNDRKGAEAEIDTLFEWASWLKATKMSLITENGSLKLDLRIKLRSVKNRKPVQ